MKEWLVKLLLVLELITGISAICGGYVLVVTNGMGMPLTFLNNTPFSSYFWPGVILAGVVGGLNILAVIALLQKFRFQLEVSAIAGLGLLIWIVVEVYLIQQSSPLQLIYFCISFIMLMLTRLLMLVRKEEEHEM